MTRIFDDPAKCAAKAGVIGFSRGVAPDRGYDGIAAGNALLISEVPGFVMGQTLNVDAGTYTH